MAALLVLLGAAPVPRAPHVAPPVYVSRLYNLTFSTPAGSYYCPLPRDWSGSDHGTIIFLRKPAGCFGVGYPSSARDFMPDDVARIEVYYGYVPDPDKKRATCTSTEHVTLFTREYALCISHWHGLSIYTIARPFRSYPLSEASFTLVTSRARQSVDLVAFRAFLAGVRPCRWMDKGTAYGFGAPCPASASEY